MMRVFYSRLCIYVFDTEFLLRLFDSLISKNNLLVFFFHRIVFLLDEPSCDSRKAVIKMLRIRNRSGNNQRRTRLIYQYGINFVYYRVIESTFAAPKLTRA